MTEEALLSPTRSALLRKLKQQKNRLDNVLSTKVEETNRSHVKRISKKTKKHTWTKEEQEVFSKIAEKYKHPTIKDWTTIAAELNNEMDYDGSEKLSPMQCQNHYYNSLPKNSRIEPQVEQTVKRTPRHITTKYTGVKNATKIARGKHTFLSAAMTVIREAAIPLTATEIARRVLEKDLVATKGKTPELTIAARIYSDLKQKGSASMFTYVQPYVFGLREFGDVDTTSRKRKKCNSKVDVAAPPKRKRRVIHGNTIVEQSVEAPSAENETEEQHEDNSTEMETDETVLTAEDVQALDEMNQEDVRSGNFTQVDDEDIVDSLLNDSKFDDDLSAYTVH